MYKPSKECVRFLSGEIKKRKKEEGGGQSCEVDKEGWQGTMRQLALGMTPQGSLVAQNPNHSLILPALILLQSYLALCWVQEFIWISFNL